MTGEQVAAPSSPRDGEDVAMTLDRPKVSVFWPKLTVAVKFLIPFCFNFLLEIILNTIESMKNPNNIEKQCNLTMSCSNIVFFYLSNVF